jgi:hypothetical protein
LPQIRSDLSARPGFLASAYYQTALSSKHASLAGTDTVLAVNSYVTNNNCAGVTYSKRIDIPEVLAWIESFL